MRTYTPKKSRLQVESLEDRVALAGGFTLSSVLPAAEVGSAQGGGTVLPATARPYGYSLTDMSQKTAPFNVSGNDPQYYPKTPFQVLYADSNESTVETVNGGTAVTGGNNVNFNHVSPGTSFYVPLLTVDDSPPIVGTFPTHASDAAGYFFGSDQVGAKDTEIIVDGKSTLVGAAYLAGPVKTQPLPDGGGTHIITLGVFLSPMSKGTHTVEIKGEFAGDAFRTTYQTIFGNFLREDFTYVVHVG
jgi:hypothetical protein